MVILELHLQHFGKFENQKFRFHTGVNIISGENGSGKSTILSFIRAMFYGFPRRSARRMDEYALRQPWENPAWYAGSMTVEQSGTMYRIERNFVRQDASLRVINVTDGREMPHPEEVLKTLLGGMSEAAFLNTVYCTAEDSFSPEVLSEEMTRSLQSQTAGQNAQSVREALERLKEQKSKREREIRAQVEQLDEKIAAAKLEVTYLERDLAASVHAPGGESADSGQQLENTREASGQETYTQEKRDRIPESADTASLGKAITALLLVAGILSGVCALLVQSTKGKIVLLLLAAVLLSVGLAILAYAYDRRQRQAASRERRQRNMDRMPSESENGDPGLAHGDAVFEEGHARNAGMLSDRIARRERGLALAKETLETLTRQRDALTGYDEESAALSLARSRLIEVSKEAFAADDQRFAVCASGILQEVSGGLLRGVCLDENREIRINQPDRLLYPASLGSGVGSLCVFALRMAGAQLMHSGVPILMDDPFARCDDVSRSRLLSWLEKNGRQVIYFTCRQKNSISD